LTLGRSKLGICSAIDLPLLSEYALTEYGVLRIFSLFRVISALGRRMLVGNRTFHGTLGVDHRRDPDFGGLIQGEIGSWHDAKPVAGCAFSMRFTEYLVATWKQEPLASSAQQAFAWSLAVSSTDCRKNLDHWYCRIFYSPALFAYGKSSIFLDRRTFCS
jgi:hypothetical protein